MTTVHSTSLITRVDYVEFIELDADRGVILDPKAGSYFEFNATGGAIWKLLGQPSTPSDIAQQLSTDFGDVIDNDVSEFLQQLADRGLVVTAT